MLLAALVAWPQQFDHRSAFLHVALAPDQPKIRELSVDSLGKHKLVGCPGEIATTTEFAC